MAFTIRTFKYLDILPDGSFIFSKNLPLKNKKRIFILLKSLNESAFWSKNINKIQVSELENFEVLNFRNKFKI